VVATLSELAARVQRGRTTACVLETAGTGVLQLGMRLAAFQIENDEMVLRYVATAPTRLAAIEQHVGRAVRGLRAPLASWALLRDVVEGRRVIYRDDLDLFEKFLRTATGFDAAPLDATPETAGIPNGVLAPLWVRERPWGILLLVSPTLTPRDADAVALFATHVASSLELAEYIEALETANRDLAEAQRELAERERLAALGELAAIVAHEVRNPIGVLFNAIGSLRRLLPPAVAEGRRGDAEVLLSIANEEADRLNHIVSDLLDFARPAAPVFEEGSMREVIRDAVSAALSDPSSSTAIEVDVQVAAGLPQVAMDTRCLRQALLNVLLNGVQAMRDCGRLTVRARIDRRGARDFARVDVSDTGPGIPTELRARIFEPFFTTKASGTGLGLAIVNRIVTAHGGDVLVDSSPAGTTFSLLVPVEVGS
jgi:signal transduction histidine kinase